MKKKRRKARKPDAPRRTVVIATPRAAEAAVLAHWSESNGCRARQCSTANQFLTETFKDACVLGIVATGFARGGGLGLVSKVVMGGSSALFFCIVDEDAVSNLDTVFEAGATDFVLRPYSLDDLLARTRRLLRYQPGGESGVIRCGRLLVDADRRHAMVGRRRVQLYPTEFKVLVFLLENAGRVVSAHDITTRALQREDSIGFVRNQICVLRRKLAEAGYRDLITTVRDKGYRISTHAVAMRRSIGDA